MNLNRGITAMLMVTAISLFLNAEAFAKNSYSEPKKPDVSKKFDPEKEKKINDIAQLPMEEAFEEIKTDEFLSDPDLMYKAIDKAFSDRKADTVIYAANYLMSPLKNASDGKTSKRIKDFDAARRIFETFPEDATPILLSFYDGGNAETKGNTARAAGRVAGGREIRNLLMKALDDNAYYEEEYPDSSGEPMRICDMAYNQLVLRYAIRNVLRTLSPAHRVEVRDYHIGILKDALK